MEIYVKLMLTGAVPVLAVIGLLWGFSKDTAQRLNKIQKQIIAGIVFGVICIFRSGFFILPCLLLCILPLQIFRFHFRLVNLHVTDCSVVKPNDPVGHLLNGVVVGDHENGVAVFGVYVFYEL